MNYFLRIILVLFLTAIYPDINTAQIKLTDSNQQLGQDGYGCVLGDLNKDGFLDIYIANADLGPDQILFNNGSGIFSNSGQNIGGSVKRDRSIALADLNGDGSLDVFLANDQTGNPTGCPNEVWINNGFGRFSDSGQRLGNFASSEAALEDIDGDGDIDAVVANLHTLEGISQPNEIWLNDGNAVFTKYEVNLGERAYSLTLADINNDGRKDIIFDCTLWINNGGLNFTKSTQSFGNALRLFFGDFDNDDDIDAFVLKGGPNGDQPNEIWLNDGSGNFSDSGQRLGNSCAYSAAIGDYDNDGDSDVYVANGFFNKIESDVLWINQGGKQNGTIGVFEESGIMLPPSRSWEVKSGDLDNDGDLDFFVANGWNRHEDNKIFFTSQDTSSTYLNERGKLPDDFQLFQNYPNPFNPTTMISYQLPVPGNVNLKIYDIIGREIKSLVDSFQSVGDHSIVWNGLDENNNQICTGIYLYSLQINEMNLQKKMMLVQ